MKKSLFLYLFIISAIMNVFMYMYFSKKNAADEGLRQSQGKNLRDSLSIRTAEIADANYFSLENNQNAQNYFDSGNSEKVIVYEKLIPVLKENLMDLNANPKGNPFTGQDQIGPQKFIINKVKVLNHRWIIADFSDGEYWGEVLLKYFINDDDTISFEIIQSLLYQKQKQE